MIREVFFICLFVYATPVSSNPVAQVIPSQQCAICQNNPYNNPSSTQIRQQQVSQNNPYPQAPIVQNAIQSHGGNLGDINQLLMNKIMSNQCLKRILDPNTKLFNQNGQEIQRQPNAGTPSVVNNYFILPPEVFLPNNTIQKVEKPKSKKKTHSRKTTHSKTKKNGGDTVVSKELKGSSTNTGRSKGTRARNKNDEKLEQFVDMDDEEDDYEDAERIKVKRTKNRRKSSRPKNKNVKSTISIPSDVSDENDDEIVMPVNKNNQKKKRKQRRKSKPRSKVIRDDSEEVVIVENENQENFNTKNKKGADETFEANLGDGEDNPHLKENESHLKNIELPLDNLEVTKDLMENKLLTRNSKNIDESMSKIKPMSDDNMFNNFFPYMPFNNYFTPQGNYPFDFGQFYQPQYNRNNRKSRKRTNRRKQSKESNGDTLPNVLEIKLKQKKRPVTTENPIDVEKSDDDIEDELESVSIEVTTQNVPVSEIPMIIPHNVSPIQDIQNSFEEFEEPSILTRDSEENKENFQSTSEIIEDLYEYMTPELGREDIVPIVYNNGIINDYYPTFNDDAYYSSDEIYQLKDLEDERLFYSTDGGQEDSYNRDRRKYDKYDYKIPHNIKDRINFRRGFLNKDRETIKNVDFIENSNLEPTYEYKQEVKTLKVKDNNEVKFQMPPLLENPDFISKKIDTVLTKANNYDAPYYIPETNTKSPLYSRHTNAGDMTIPTNDPDHVETFFVKTRVVKYGGSPMEKPKEDPVNDKSEFSSDGHTTYVVAKSLGPVEDFYWQY